jgi:alpha-beta hydrolase superfamily lysophospholipase
MPGMMALKFDPERLHQQIARLTPDTLKAPAVGIEYGDAVQTYFLYYGLDFERFIAGVGHHFGHFTSGKYEIVCHYFTVQQPRGTCFIFHGYFDHVGLFRHAIEYCLRRDLNVVIYDLPGHGLSTGARATITSFIEYEQVLKDCLQLFLDIAPQPWHAIAQSTGCAVLMDYLLLQEAPGFDKVVLLAPLVRAAEWRWVKAIHFLGQYFVDAVDRKYVKSSSDEAFLKFIHDEDPLQSRQIPIAWVDALIRWERRFESLPQSDRAPLILQGQRDTTVDWKFNISAIREKFPRAKYLPLQDAAHHLVNELPAIRAKMFAAMDLYFQNKSPGE